MLAVDLPGHGETAASAAPRLGDGGRAIAAGLRQRGFTAPVIVGHSTAAVDATFYAAEHAVRGVVCVDTMLQVEGFVTMLRLLAGRYDRDYPAMWRDVLLPSLRIAQLPNPAGACSPSTAHPPGMCSPVGWTRCSSARSRSSCRRRRRLSTGCGRRRRPTSPCSATRRRRSISTGSRPTCPTRVSRSGPDTHFPHLADPARFARLLAATADW